MNDVYVWDWFMDLIWWDGYGVDMKYEGVHG